MEWLLWLLGGVCCGAVVIAVVGVLAWIMIADSRQKKRTLGAGERVTAWLVQANMKLFEDGWLDLPALVLISPDEETAADKEFMLDLADRIMELKGIDPDDCNDKQ